LATCFYFIFSTKLILAGHADNSVWALMGMRKLTCATKRPRPRQKSQLALSHDVFARRKVNSPVLTSVQVKLTEKNKPNKRLKTY
jgi:hypothetical protein